jgi:replicative DNA helicase
MAIESALLKQLLSHNDFETWNRLKQHYLPEGDYQKLWKIVDKHVHKFQALPSFENLKYEVRSRELQEKIYAIEAVETDTPAGELLEYLKDQFTQSEILSRIEFFLDNTITLADAKENIDALQEIVVQVQDKVDTSTDSESMEDIELFDSEEELSQYLPLGLNTDYDLNYTFSPRDLVVVGAQRGHGKSFTCCNIAVSARERGHSVLYFTIEMDTRPILQRMAAMSTGIPLGRLMKRNLFDKEWTKIGQWWADRFEGAEDILSKYDLSQEFDKFHYDLSRNYSLKKENQLEVFYDPSLTLAKVISTVRQKKVQYPDLGLVVVDYLNQVRRHNAPSKGGQYEWTEQIEISKGLKALAQEQNCLVISAFQTDVQGNARFSKGILDAVDAAYTLQHWGREENCIKFRCDKMRSGEMQSFISEIDWDCLKIGPNSAMDPDERQKMKEEMMGTGESYDDL